MSEHPPRDNVNNTETEEIALNDLPEERRRAVEGLEKIYGTLADIPEAKLGLAMSLPVSKIDSFVESTSKQVTAEASSKSATGNGKTQRGNGARTTNRTKNAKTKVALTGKPAQAAFDQHGLGKSSFDIDPIDIDRAARSRVRVEIAPTEEIIPADIQTSDTQADTANPVVEAQIVDVEIPNTDVNAEPQVLVQDGVENNPQEAESAADWYRRVGTARREELLAMYGGKTPITVLQENSRISATLSDKDRNLNADALKDLHSFMLDQWSKTASNRTGDYNQNYSQWSNDLKSFSAENAHLFYRIANPEPHVVAPKELRDKRDSFVTEYADALNAGNVSRMQEIKREAEAFYTDYATQKQAPNATVNEPDIRVDGVTGDGNAVAGSVVEQANSDDHVSLDSDLPPDATTAEPGLMPFETVEESRVIPFDEIENVLREQLKGKAKITHIEIVETPSGLQLHAELDAGIMGGKISLDGVIANANNTIVVSDINIDARPYVKSMIEDRLSGFDAAIKSHFEAEYGKSVSSMKVTGSGLVLGFDSSQEDLDNTEDPENDSANSGIDSLFPDTSDNSADLDGDGLDLDVPGADRNTTPAENRKGFKDVMKRAGKMFGWESADGGTFKERSERLRERVSELDSALAAKVEGLAEKLGEKYNQAPTWEKIALGGLLAFGFGLSSSWLAVGFGTALVASRFAAMSGSFMNNRRLLESIHEGTATGKLANTKFYKWLGSGSTEKSRKNAAMAKALVTSFGMTGIMSFGAHELKEHHVAEKLGQWIGEHLYNVTHADAAATAIASAEDFAKNHQDMKEIASRAALLRGEVSATDSSPEPAQNVGGVSTSEQTEAPNAVAPEAQVQSPLEIPNFTIEAEAGKGTEFMMKSYWQQLQNWGLNKDDYPEGTDIYKLLSATPENIDEVVHNIASSPNHNFFRADGTSVQIGLDSHLAINAQGNVEISDAKLGEHVVQAPPEQPSGAVTAENSGPTADEQLLPAQKDSQIANGGMDVESSSIAPSEAVSVTDKSFVVNHYHLTIPVAEPHIYMDAHARHMVAYGGSPFERARIMKEYLQQNLDKVICAADDKNETLVAWRLVDGRLMATPMRTNGLFGFFSTFMKPPEVENLKSLIK